MVIRREVGNHGLSEGHVVVVLGPRGEAGAFPGVIPVSLVIVEIGDNSRAVLGQGIEGVPAEGTELLGGLIRAVEDEHQAAAGRGTG